MSHYKLVGLPASRAARNLWMLEELGVPYESDPIHFTDPALKKSPYIDWNPNGSIPFLLIDGKPMFESLAINMYLAGKHRKLCGASSEEGGLCAQWTLWAATALEPLVGQWAYHTFTVADLNAAAVAWRVLSMPLAAQYPATAAWIEKCWARPAAVKVRRLRGDKI
jgi:glutathione S-transferase